MTALPLSVIKGDWIGRCVPTESFLVFTMTVKYMSLLSHSQSLKPVIAPSGISQLTWRSSLTRKSLLEMLS